MKINTQSVHFDADVKLIDFVEKKLEKLELFFDRIIDAQVVLKLENSGKVKDKIAEIKINVPGEAIVSRGTSQTFEAAVDLAVNALRRQLIRFKERQRTY